MVSLTCHRSKAALCHQGRACHHRSILRPLYLVVVGKRSASVDSLLAENIPTQTPHLWDVSQIGTVEDIGENLSLIRDDLFQ